MGVRVALGDDPGSSVDELTLGGEAPVAGEEHGLSELLEEEAVGLHGERGQLYLQ